MYKLILTIVFFTQGILFAHCDGCAPEEAKSDKDNTGGTLSGNVKYQGKVPKAKPLRMDADPVCGSSHDGTVLSESFIVDENLNLKNVIVWLKDIKYEGEIPHKPAILNQIGCVYDPHVLAVVKGQKVLIQNSDATLHNIHSMAEINEQFNFAMPKVVKEKETTFNSVEDPFYIKCDVHPWMKSWVLVQDHPYFAVTDSDGNFTISDIPSGTYEVIAWQEKFKMQRAVVKTVEIKSDFKTVQDFIFIKPEKK